MIGATHAARALRDGDLCEPEVLRLPVAGGQSIALDWYAAGPQAPALLFVHGLGSHRRGEKVLYFAERFQAAGRAVAALDLRGHGDSDGAMRDLTMRRMLADLDAAAAWLRERSAPRRILLVGSSMGAAVAAWHAVRSPQDIEGLVLIAPSLEFPASLTRTLDPTALADWRRTGLRRFTSEWLDLEIGAGLLEEAGSYDPVRLASELRVPWLLVHGVRDEVIPWQRSVEFVRAAGNAAGDLYLIGTGDHRLTAHKQLLFEMFGAWLERRTGPPAA